MKLTTLGKAGVVLLSLLFPANGRVSAQIIAVTAGTLIDPDTGPEKAKQTILIDGRTIVAVGSNCKFLVTPNGLTSRTKLSCQV